MIAPLDVPMAEIDLETHTLLGWPRRGVCPNNSDHEAALLVAVHDHASYECRGTPSKREDRSAYSDDRCSMGSFRVQRGEVI